MNLLLRIFIVLNLFSYECSAMKQQWSVQTDPQLAHYISTLNGIVAEYNQSKDHKVSVESQKKYGQMLEKLEQYLQQKQLQGYDISGYQKSYVDLYQNWKYHIVPMLQPSQNIESFKVIQDAKIKEIYEQVASEVNKALQIFFGFVQGRLSKLQRNNQDDFDQFEEDIAGAVKTFESRIITVRQGAIDVFRRFLQEHNQLTQFFPLTAEQRDLSTGLKKMTVEALDFVHEAAHALQEELHQKRLEADLRASQESTLFFDRNKEADGYSWLSRFKESSGRVMADFYDRSIKLLKKQVLQEVEKTTQKATQDIDDAVIGYSEKKAKEVEGKLTSYLPKSLQGLYDDESKKKRGLLS